MEKGEAEHGYPQGAKAERCIFGNLLCFLPVFRNAGAENIIHSQFLPLRRNKGPEEMTQPPSHGFGAERERRQAAQPMIFSNLYVAPISKPRNEKRKRAGSSC